MLLQNWISRYGTIQLHSNQVRNSTSAVVKGLCKLLETEKTQTTLLHPQSDGVVERFNRMILNSLSHLVSKTQQDSNQKLPLFLLAHRSDVHETTYFRPSQISFGRDLRLSCDLLFWRPPDAPSSTEDKGQVYMSHQYETLTPWEFMTHMLFFLLLLLPSSLRF